MAGLVLYRNCLVAAQWGAQLSWGAGPLQAEAWALLLLSEPVRIDAANLEEDLDQVTRDSSQLQLG